VESSKPKLIERRLIETFLAPGAEPDPEIVIQSREMTGAGFCLAFTVAASLRPLDADELPNGPMRGPEIVSPDLRDGAGSLLWPDSSGVHELEVYTYTEAFPEDLREFSLQQS
jgi:hypothetical protein